VPGRTSQPSIEARAGSNVRPCFSRARSSFEFLIERPFQQPHESRFTLASVRSLSAMLSSLSHRRRAANLPIDRHVAIYKPPAREEFAIAKKTHAESMRLLIEQLCAPEDVIDVTATHEGSRRVRFVTDVSTWTGRCANAPLCDSIAPSRADEDL
jgi:hypothetical protein